MPYIITTVYPWADANEPARRARDRTAVATLDEAREAAHSAIPAPTCGDYHGAIYSLSDSGGTVGPLPDGTVIEVRPASWSELAQSLPAKRRAYVTAPAYVHGYTGEILAAFNAADRDPWAGVTDRRG